MKHPSRVRTTALALALAGLAALPAAAAPGDQPVTPLPAGRSKDDASRVRKATLPAKGLFVGDKLSESTKARLSELIMDSIGMRIEMALLVPSGHWKIDGAGKADNDLNAARLQALRRFLTDRGVDPRRIYVESRIDPKIKTPRLEVQLLVSPSND